MGQKVHPKGLRLGIIEDWDSSWYVKSSIEFARFVKEDDVIRKFVLARLASASVSSVLIHRKSERVVITIVTGRSGVVIGRGGQNLDQLRSEIALLVNSRDIRLEVVEVDKIDQDAVLLAQSVAQQLEKRVSFRRVMKQTMQKAMRSGAQGVKVMISGRLAGADIARTEWAKDGRVPLHTLKAGIQYSTCEAHTLFGVIGVKVWVYTGNYDTTTLMRHNIRQAGDKRGGGNNDRNNQGAGPAKRRPGRRGPSRPA
jgi:small subunit ribosomal protein S3